jgi:Gamma-aminobutyrate permease and related permeases
MPGFPFTSWLTIIFFIGVLVILFFVKSTRLPLLISFVWFIALFVGYTIVDKRKQAKD